MESLVEFAKKNTLAIRFPQKLWILINKSNGLIEWGRNGKTILIDTDAMDEYLASDQSIFRTKNITSLNRQLNIYGFCRISKAQIKVDYGMVSQPDIEEYRNEFFKRDCPELLPQIKRIQVVEHKMMKHREAFRRRRQCTDPCLELLPQMSRLQKCRLRLRQLLATKKMQFCLNQKLATINSQNSNVIELPNDAYENVFDSLSSFEQKSVAGYYGIVSEQMVQTFFEDYLPTYSLDPDPIEIADEDTVNNSSIIHPDSIETISLTNAEPTETDHISKMHIQYNYNGATPNLIIIQDPETNSELLPSTMNPAIPLCQPNNNNMFNEIHYTKEMKNEHDIDDDTMNASDSNQDELKLHQNDNHMINLLHENQQQLDNNRIVDETIEFLNSTPSNISAEQENIENMGNPMLSQFAHDNHDDINDEFSIGGVIQNTFNILYNDIIH